jgi:MFS family permease
MEESGTIISFPDVIYIIIGPFLGYLTDKKGKKGIIMMFGFLMCIASHFLFYRFPACDLGDRCYEGIFPMVFIGMANTMIHLSIYPTVNYIVHEKYFGTAYGFIESSTNIGYLFGSLTLGDILNKENGLEKEETDL